MSPRAVVRVALVCTLLVAMLTLAGCNNGKKADEVVVNGSTTILPIAEIAAEQYMDENPDISVLVSGVGSSAGIETVSRGSSDIGTSSRDLKLAEEEELGLVDTPIAYDAIAIIVNPDNPVRELSTEQVRGIFSGRITNWSEVGGSDLPIGLVNRDEASGTREAFKKIVMGDENFDIGAVVLPGTGQVRSVVAAEPRAVAYISLGFVNDRVTAVTIDGIMPSEEAVIVGTYPVSRILHCFTLGEPSGWVADFLGYILSLAVQDTIVRDAGFIPITARGALDG